MAVELTHRVILEGPRSIVLRFKRDLARPRVPFSFKALWKRAQYPGEPPCDPYNLSGFPARTIGRGRSEIRYTFLTRNLELDAILLGLLRSYPKLTCRLATIADDGDVWTFLIRRGRRRRRDAPEWLTTYHYERVAWENGITREKVEDSYNLGWEADFAVLDDAVNLFNDVAPRRMPWPVQTWGGRRVRLMEDEQETLRHIVLARGPALDFRCDGGKRG